MRFLILGLLLPGPLALYDLHKRFAGGIALFYAASFGSIQRALSRLDEQGLVTASDVPGSARRKRLYAVTDEGRAAWRAWMQAPIDGSDAEPTVLAKVYLLGQLPVAERRSCVATVRTRIADDAAALDRLADELDATEVPGELREIYRFQRATLDYGRRSHALTLAWLDELGLDALGQDEVERVERERDA